MELKEVKLDKSSVDKFMRGKPSGYTPATIKQAKERKHKGTVYIRDYPHTHDMNYPHDVVLNRCYLPNIILSNGNLPESVQAKSVIAFGKDRDYDLSNPDHWYEFNFIKNHPFTKGGTLVCTHKGEESRNKVNLRLRSSKAEGIISNLNGDRLYDFARLMYIGQRVIIDNSSDSTLIKGMLLESIDESVKSSDKNSFVERIISLDNDESFVFKVTALKAINSGLIKREQGFYYYDQSNCGAKFEDVVEYLQEDDRHAFIREELEELEKRY